VHPDLAVEPGLGISQATISADWWSESPGTGRRPTPRVIATVFSTAARVKGQRMVLGSFVWLNR